MRNWRLRARGVWGTRTRFLLYLRTTFFAGTVTQTVQRQRIIDIRREKAEGKCASVVGFALLGSSPSVSEGRVHMDDATSDILDQTDEDILTYTVSDEALEAAGAEATATGHTIYPYGACTNVEIYC
jgi:hypothetical protein